MSDHLPLSVTVLENAYALTIGSDFCIDGDPDVIEQLLSDTRSPNTKRAYQKDLNDFFLFISGKSPSQDLVLEFLHLEQRHAVAVVLKYKAYLVNKKQLAEATVNRRLSAIKSLTVMGRKLGACNYTLEDIKGEKVESYRDTTGIAATDFAKVLGLVDRETLKGKRDYAILRLLWDNALRRSEVCNLNVGDFDAASSTLSILGKGKGTQKIVVDLSRKTVEAVADWLIASKRATRTRQPLFTVIAYNGNGKRLSGEAIRRLVSGLCKEVGITKQMSPHRIRHSSITTVLDKNNGNYRATQRFSRHAKPDTVMKYDDNRQKLQKQMTDILADLV
ncbi:tyrosine-type recombinase/integrase [Calothrix sp. 336/3]|uniref:tyrosine-type recombinase/integrase n=1 Tax=Calothrix sp. 336/3 TaxID=1337936 RepID=UPI0004E3C361|nr:tyrosine-type recombinase/integrase [Calothrix sp. 336/3]AKG24862.1 integrase [Calothrix sp. 336/3]